MKLATRTIPDFLRQPDKSCVAVLIYGPDAGLARERAKLIAQVVLGPGADSLNLSELSPEQLKEDPSRLVDALSSLSLLGGKNVVILRDAGDRQTKLVEIALTHPGRTHFLIVIADELATRSSLRQLFEAGATFAALPCYRDEAGDISNLVRKRLEQEGVRASPDAVNYLAEHLGNDRMVTQSELDKVMLYLGEEKELVLSAVLQLVGHNRDIVLDELALAVGAQDARALDERLAHGFREGIQSIAVLRAVSRHFQRLLRVRQQTDDGMSLEGAMGMLRPAVFFRHQQNFARQAQFWDTGMLMRALRGLNEAELACKTTGSNAPLITSRALLKISKMGRLKVAAA